LIREKYDSLNRENLWQSKLHENLNTKMKEGQFVNMFKSHESKQKKLLKNYEDSKSCIKLLKLT